MIESFTRDQLIACGEGEMFGPENGRLPLPNMLMMDRITHISDEGGAFGKGRIKPNSTSRRTSGSSSAISAATR